jgi:hypothetical protein
MGLLWIYTELDAVEKYVVAGNKLKPFIKLKRLDYDYLTLVIDTYKEKCLLLFKEEKKQVCYS